MNGFELFVVANAVTLLCAAPLVWLLSRKLNARPALRHALWLVLLVKMITPPLIELPIVERARSGHPVVGEIVPDLVGSVRAVLERLDEGPVFVDVSGRRVGISKFDVQRFLATRIGLIRGQSERLPALVTWMEEGDFDDVALELLEERAGAPLWTAMSWMMDAASGASPARLARIEEEARETLLADAVNFPYPWTGEAWGSPDLGEEFRAPLVSTVPVLFLTGELDARTPASNARELMEHLSTRT